ncbi:MAG: metallophosphoesterase family protein [Magnetococcales bacterium]|nr:metallophosphoesterase family protein [Magnetococcales bacterium]
MKRFVGWMLVGVGVVCVLAVLLNESNDLEVTRHRLGREGGTGGGIRIAQVSDLHIVGGAAIEERVLRELQREDPDLVVLTGDMVTKPERMEVLGLFLDRLSPRSQKVAIPGNWEYWGGIDMLSLRRFYAGHGVTLLINESRMAGRGELLVVGLDDARHGRPDWEKAMVDHGQWRGPTLVLAHNPVTLGLLSERERSVADRVMLSGHTHGGQIVVFGMGWRREQPCLAGWCRELGMPLYVSRGIGTSVIALRIGAPPELAFFEWRW